MVRDDWKLIGIRTDMNHVVVIAIAASLLVACSDVSVPQPADMKAFDAAIAKQVDSAVEALRRCGGALIPMAVT